MNLISNDTSYFPLGVDRELGEDETMIAEQGAAAYERIVSEYDSHHAKKQGELSLAQQGNPPLENQKKKVPRFLNKKQIAEFLNALDEEMESLRKSSEELTSEIVHLKDLYFTMKKHNFEIEEWRQLHDIYAEMLNKHIALKDSNAAKAAGSRAPMRGTSHLA
jgi:hypothetical protein